MPEGAAFLQKKKPDSYTVMEVVAISNLYAAEKYKQTVMDLLCENDNFIKLVHPIPSVCPDLNIQDVLRGGKWTIDGKEWAETGHVFDYNLAGDTLSENRTFVCIETEIETIRDNIFTDFNLYVYVFTAKNLVRLDSASSPTAGQTREMGYYASDSQGNRIGALCDCVDHIINGTDRLECIGNVTPAAQNHMTPYMPNNHYYGKCLKYRITNYNMGGDDYGN